MALIVITPPSVEPVTLAEAKLQCKVDFIDDDTLITALIVAAREQAEHRTGRALCTQTLEHVLDSFPDGIELQRPPIAFVVSVKYVDASGVEQTLDPLLYSLDKDSEPGWVVPAYGTAWPETRAVPNAVRVRYTAGYGVAVAVPQSIKAWMLMAIAALYNQRAGFTVGSLEAANELPRDFFAGLLDRYWIPGL
jgi:uncharacterized phiE125 gp8 family phage protein